MEIKWRKVSSVFSLLEMSGLRLGKVYRATTGMWVATPKHSPLCPEFSTLKAAKRAVEIEEASWLGGVVAMLRGGTVR